jgi:hypothetical protein
MGLNFFSFLQSTGEKNIFIRCFSPDTASCLFYIRSSIGQVETGNAENRLFNRVGDKLRRNENVSIDDFCDVDEV